MAVAGHTLRTREDVRRYLDEISERNRESSRATRLWHTAKQGMWLLLLVSAYLQYYFLDVLVQIDSMPGISVSVSKKVPQRNSAHQLYDLRKETAAFLGFHPSFAYNSILAASREIREDAVSEQ